MLRRLRVKLDAETDEMLSRISASRGKSKDQLVREAISLAREMGMHLLELGRWFAERGIPRHTALGSPDADRA
jgi:hypothetical protein